MISFTCEIERFNEKGDKTSWSYVFIPKEITEQLKPGFRRSYRVRGNMDGVLIEGMALLPVKEGGFILALKASIRKMLRKEAGASVTLQLTEDTEFKITMPEDLEMCLLDGEGLLEQFLSLAKSHQNYFINYINQAKTEGTREKRIG